MTEELSRKGETSQQLSNGRFIAALITYVKPRTLSIFALGMASGFPLTFVISLVGYWLSRYGLDRGTVGLFIAATSFYTWKFLWSPAIDQIPLGVVTRVFGQRRGWLFVIQIAMALALFGLASLNPDEEILLVAVLVALVAFLSASQDIVIDAYRIEIVPGEDLAHSASALIFGYRTANAIAGIGALYLADSFGWGVAIASLPLLFLPSLFAVWYMGEPDHTGAHGALAGDVNMGFRERVYEAVVMPFKEFSSRKNWLLILLFVFVFKAGDAVTSVMTPPLLVEMGYSDIVIANANKLVGLVALLVGTFLGAVLYRMWGAYPALFFTGILMMITNLGFAWLVSGDASAWRLAVTIGFENFATGLGATVTVAYFSSLCNISYTATQYALISSLGNQARTLLGTPSGYAATELGWVNFFVAATLVAIPGLVLLYILWRRSPEVNQADLSEAPAVTE